jgi:hypothetical protein
VAEPTTKSELLNKLREKRAEWDAAVAQVASDRMTQAGAQGEWAAKDIVMHLAYYERWMADRMHEQLRGENYIPTELDMMHFDARNEIVFQRNRGRALEDVMAESRRAFQDILSAVEAHTEAFLFQPHQFEGAPGPVIIADMLRSEVYDHYAQHIPYLNAWAAAPQK